MRVLVTGGAGFIGSHLVRHLADAGHQVFAVDDLSGGWVENVDSRARFERVDLTDWPHVQAIYRTYLPDVTFHMAAYAAEGLSHWVRGFNYRNNLVASSHLVSCAMEWGGRLVVASSMAVYGDQHPPFTEEMTPKPVDPYGIAKYAVESDLRVAGNTHGVEYTIVRPHNVYGPGQNLGDPYRNVVGIFLRQALAGLPLTVFGDGSQTRAFSYIEDVAPAIIAAADHPGETFNVGGDEVHTVLELAQRVSRLFDVGIVHLDPRHEVAHAWCDHEKAKRMLGFAPKVPLDEGLMRMASWAEKAGVRWSKTPRIEIYKRLPESWK